MRLSKDDTEAAKGLQLSLGTWRDLYSSNVYPNHIFNLILQEIFMKKLLSVVAASLFALVSASSFAQSGGPNDAQIAGIVVAANTVDINAGKLAMSRSKNKEVKEFAKRMVTDHTGVNKQASALVKKLNVTPEESDTSKGLKQSGADTMAKLKSLKGKEFDRAYIDNEVAYHQTVMDALDKTLIPSAKNEELKALLVKVRPAFVAHLEHAKHMQSSMK
jgi:putative membrane protein